MAVRSMGEHTVTDVVGIGFGPANLALAVALREQAAGAGQGGAGEGGAVRARFVEKQPQFGWHRGMLIEGATMQVSFLKDLATVRNPTSSFGYLSYLQAKGRLLDFINNKNFFPLRVEYHDYLDWAAAQFTDEVDYGSEVEEIRPVTDERGVTELLDVVVRRGGELITLRTRNVVVATGLSPVLPPGAVNAERTWHSSELLRRTEQLDAMDPKRLVVVGAGQSAAEVVAHLHDRYPRAEVHAVLTRYGYSVADDSAFANRIFDPAAVDHYFEASEEVKRKLLGYHANTNYSVVDLDLIQDLYQRSYLEDVTGRRRLHIRNISRLLDVATTDDGVSARIEYLPTGEIATLDADAVVYATGYRPSDPVDLLGDLAASCKRDDRGLLQVGRDYRVVTEESLRAGIYLQGPTEHSHGISSGLLSNIGVRAGEIADTIALGLSGTRTAAATGHAR
ncbi:lysine N(6)-hydroxylase/L-ornithine N(5)-oxygenase family protein [Kitasatospora sp. NBC_01560]|uniref:lysine N(6)-hydroxylase/L-ornithine N(5)-oxygenase family protein n=1 Tax=Kitasatospora sp. NBC_01560 TaxID=2975965 RepID=UPI003863B91F